MGTASISTAPASGFRSPSRGGNGWLSPFFALILTQSISAAPPPPVWQNILAAIGAPTAGIIVANPNTPASESTLVQVRAGSLLLLEGDSPLARFLGVQPTARRVRARHAIDIHAPDTPAIWSQSEELAVCTLPAGATVFTKERWSDAPLAAGWRLGAGAVLWLAASPGAQGYERFPWLAQALGRLGLKPALRSNRLWAFFDSSYRLRADADYLAARWRAAGIAALHVAAWHYWEPDPARDAWLTRLVAACHRRGIQVYAWVELPHVSERFWQEHPDWREQTAIGQDAHLDWRKLMNFARPDCAAAVATGFHALLGRFDWDGVNLAELYFESLEGYLNPARFTPFNADVRTEFRRAHGFDPAELFQPASPRYHAKTAAGMRAFLEYRAALARRLQQEWIAQLDFWRKSQPHLDLALTHVDDRFDATMRDKIGADAARLLADTERRDLTFLIEDPATVWHLGPGRYPEIARRYAGLTRHPERLAIDVNVVERYQDVYPTKQQTGMELFQLLHLAAQAFDRVAIYFESSLSRTDLDWLPAAAAAVRRFERTAAGLAVESPAGVSVAWDGPARVNGRPWPAAAPGWLHLPRGKVQVERDTAACPLRLTALNATLEDAERLPTGLRFRYASKARAYAEFDQPPARVTIDGVSQSIPTSGPLVLPRGTHEVRAWVRAGD